MTLTSLDAAAHSHVVSERRAPYWQREEAPRFRVGQSVELQVQQHLGEYRYAVSLAGQRQIVESAMSLEVGGTVRATVVAIGDKLELKYVDSRISSRAVEATPAEALQAQSKEGAALAQLQARHAVSLTPGQQRAIERAMSQADDPAAMAAGGIFLSKLALPVEAAALEAIYAAQLWAGGASTVTVAIDNVAQGIAPTAALLKKALESSQPDAGEPAVSADLANATVGNTPQLSAGDSGTADSGEQHDLARRLLNTQDEGSLLYRYGTLPVLISGQLVELDLVYFREREVADRRNGLRRLVMSFKTEALGRVEIVAHAVGDSLSIGMKAESAQSSTALAAHAQEVRDLVGRMGWNVGTVSYDFDSGTARAASHIVAHVLDADTLNRLV